MQDKEFFTDAQNVCENALSILLEYWKTDALFFNIARCAEILCKRGVISAQQTARRPKDVISCTELDIVRMEQKSHPGKTIFVMSNILERVKQ